MRLKKIIEAGDAVAVIHDGDVVASAGYGGNGTPDQLFVALEKRRNWIGRKETSGSWTWTMSKDSSRKRRRTGFARRGAIVMRAIDPPAEIESGWPRAMEFSVRRLRSLIGPMTLTWWPRAVKFSARW